MQVKAQGILNAGKYLETRYGQRALANVLRAVSPAVRETYTSSIAINWHPLEELCELVDVAEAQLGDGSGALAQAVGAAGARANLQGVLLRMALYLAKPTFLMTRIAGMWRQFNDEGSMELLEMTPEHASIEVHGVNPPLKTFCHIMTGWVGEVARALGAAQIVVHHPQCRARGQARCVWTVSGRVITR